MNTIQKQIREYMQEAIMESQDIYLSQCWEIVIDFVMDSVRDINYKQVGYLHTMHKELNQKSEAFSFERNHPWGVHGKDFSDSYAVTTKTVYIED